ncbi:MAG: hypothetical protein WCP33_07400 [Deltaproteobacteria bacterium]
MSRRCPKNRHLFLNWLRVNRNSFPFHLRVLEHRKTCIELNFVGVTSAIRVLFYPRSGIDIPVYWEGIHWDFLIDFDVIERRSEAGYYCALCKPEFKVYYPTREELWIKHGFEQFLEWCNTKLENANWLELFDGDGVTSAMLHKEMPEDDRHWDHLIEFADNLIPLGKMEPEKRTREIRKFIIPVRTKQPENYR